MHRIIATLIVCALPLTIQAAEQRIEGLYRHAGWCQENLGRGVMDVDQWTECKVKPVNALRIQKLQTGDYAITMEFVAFATTPSHCVFSGLFERDGDVLTLTAPYAALSCKLAIHVLPRSFQLIDEEQACRTDFCSGSNAGFDDVRFPRYDRPRHAPTMFEEGYCEDELCTPAKGTDEKAN